MDRSASHIQTSAEMYGGTTPWVRVGMLQSMILSTCFLTDMSSSQPVDWNPRYGVGLSTASSLPNLTQFDHSGGFILSNSQYDAPQPQYPKPHPSSLPWNPSQRQIYSSGWSSIVLRWQGCADSIWDSRTCATSIRCPTYDTGRGYSLSSVHGLSEPNGDSTYGSDFISTKV